MPHLGPPPCSAGGGFKAKVPQSRTLELIPLSCCPSEATVGQTLALHQYSSSHCAHLEGGGGAGMGLKQANSLALASSWHIDCNCAGLVLTHAALKPTYLLFFRSDTPGTQAHSKAQLRHMPMSSTAMSQNHSALRN